MKLYVKSSAMKRADLAADIESKTIPVMNALAQLYYFPNNVNQEHWRREVWANFHRMQRIKRTNKLPSFDFIMLNTLECNKDQFQTVKQFVLRKESECSPDPERIHNDSQFRDLTRDYFEWLATQFTTKVEIPALDVYEKLAELGL